MIKDLRQSKIIKYLDLNQKAKVEELSKLVKVSEETIRKDLIELENKDLIKRTRGGAFIKDNSFIGISNLEKKNLCKEEKIYMSKLALKFIQTKMTIFLDNSTTCIELARLILKKQLYVNIVSYSLEISNICACSDNINLYMLAGKYNKHTNSFVGAMTLDNIDKFMADIGFVSFATIDETMGFGDNNFDNLYLRKKIIRNSKKSFALMDHTKFFDKSAKVFEKINKVDGIITDYKTSDEKIKFLEKANKKIIRS